FALAVLSTFGFSEYQVELSTWDPKDRKTFMGSDDQWNSANRSLENALRRRNIPFKLIPGEAAFYGPKIDVKLVDAIGRLWQLCTVQFDFNLPERFALEYVAEDSSGRYCNDRHERQIEDGRHAYFRFSCSHQRADYGKECERLITCVIRLTNIRRFALAGAAVLVPFCAFTQQTSPNKFRLVSITA